jgi:hypothetical protein
MTRGRKLPSIREVRNESGSLTLPNIELWGMERWTAKAKALYRKNHGTIAKTSQQAEQSSENGLRENICLNEDQGILVATTTGVRKTLAPQQ